MLRLWCDTSLLALAAELLLVLLPLRTGPLLLLLLLVCLLGFNAAGSLMELPTALVCLLLLLL
jgi:hypothetical protein